MSNPAAMTFLRFCSVTARACGKVHEATRVDWKNMKVI